MYFRFFPVATLLVVGISASAAQDDWSLSLLDRTLVPHEILEDARRIALAGLPDGLVEVYDGEGDITSAWYGGPTTRYRHGVLGDAVEASMLVVGTGGGKEFVLTLPESEVFEDRYPRLADLDGDGKIEVVTIRSSASLGASVTVYGLSERTLVEKASTRFIGRANRWLNIAGIDRFQGRQGKEIAFVETPHIGGTLHFYEFREDGLTPVASMYGFSNHEMGSKELRLSAAVDLDGDGRAELVLPSDDRSTLRVVGFGDDGLRDIASVELPSLVDKAIGVDDSGEDVRIIVGLENGQFYAVHR